MSGPSLLLVDMILAALSAGEPVTARKLARETGADHFLVTKELRKLESQGLVRSREVRSLRKPQEKPYAVYTPVRSRVMSLINLRKGNHP